MRIEKSFRSDQEVILKFLDVLGGGSAVLSGNKKARPGFFIFAHTFIQEFIEGSFFHKEELLVEALANNGFPVDEGPVGAMLAEQTKAHDAAQHMMSAAKGWQEGDEEARGEVGWATSEYTSTLRQHIDRLKNLIFPLLEQNISPAALIPLFQILAHKNMHDQIFYLRWPRVEPNRYNFYLF